MSLDSLNDIRSKVKRAEKNIFDFRREVERFKATKPYEVVRQPDLQAGKIVYDVVKADQVWPSIPAIAGDVLQNLRTALDYMVCCLVPNCRTGIAKVYFPIIDSAPTPEQLESAFDGKVKGIDRNVVNKIAALKPYQGGDNVLWRLHRLNIIDKHRLLVAVQSQMSRFDFSGPVVIDADGFPDVAQTLDNTLVPVAGGFPLEKGGQIVIDAPPAEADQYLQFLIEIAINEPEVCQGRSLDTILLESFKRVQRVVGEFVPLIVTSKY